MSVIVEGTVYWANLASKNEMSGKYQVDLGNLDKSAAKTLKGEGIKLRTDNNTDEKKPMKGTFITAKSQYPIKIVFKDGVEQVGADEIGNGTRAKFKVNAFEWNNKFGTGISAGITKIMITDLVKYEVMDDDDEDDDWGEDVASEDGDDPFDDD